MIDIEGKLHGDVANVAYHIGEDLCDGSNVLVSSTVKDVISGLKNFRNAKFVE